MTCNLAWPEIQSQLLKGQNHTDIPIVITRIFHQKLSLLIQILKIIFSNAGKVIYCIWSVKFQKCGLPHIHILIKYTCDWIEPHEINQVVSTELPVNSEDKDLVT